MSLNYQLDPYTDVWIRGKPDEQNYFHQTIETCEELPYFPLVLMQPPDARYVRGHTNLIEFTHPENAIYIFGGNNAYFSFEEDMGIRKPNHVIYIPVQHEMYSWTAAAVVLYDRMLKENK